MSGRGFAAVTVLLVSAIGLAWGVARWRDARDLPHRFALPVPSDPAAVERVLAHLETVPAYRGVLPRPAVVGARFDAPAVVEVDLDPRVLLREGLALRSASAIEGLLPTVARGRIESIAGGIVETWRVACPDGCLLDLLDREPPRGCPSRGWSVLPDTATARVWFAVDARRLAEPTLGGAGLAPFRDRLETFERLIGRPIREELAADLAGTGVMALDEGAGPRAQHLLVVLDLKRTDRIRGLVDTLVALAVVANRAAVRRHRDVSIGVIGPSERGLSIAIDGTLLLVSDDPAPVVAAVERRRSGSDPGVPEGFASFRGSWRAESTSSFVDRGWRGARASGATPRVSASLVREGVWWWLRGEGTGPAFTADPLVPVVRARLGGAQRSPD